MSTRARKAWLSLLDRRVGVLNRGAAERSPAEEVFRTVAAILALVWVSVPVQCPSTNSRISLIQPGQDDCQQRFCPTL